MQYDPHVFLTDDKRFTCMMSMMVYRVLPHLFLVYFVTSSLCLDEQITKGWKEYSKHTAGYIMSALSESSLKYRSIVLSVNEEMSWCVAWEPDGQVEQMGGPNDTEIHCS